MVNQLPQGWKEEELGKLADVIAGQSPEGVYYNTIGEGTPFYQGKSEFQEMYLGKPTKWTTKVTKLAKKNDILMSVRAPVGPVNITQEDICIGRGLAAITAKSMLLQLYLFYHLRFLEDKISGTNGAVFASISKREIEQIKITYPTDKDEQDYIVKTLDAVAEMIKLRKETIQLTKDLIPAIFQEMFGDPNIEDVNYVPFNQFFVVVNNEKKEIKSEDYRTKADGLLPVVDQGKKEIVAYTEQLDKKISAHDNPIILFGDHTCEVKFIDFDFVVGADGTQLMRTVEGVEPLFAFWQLKMKHIESKGYSRHFKYVKAMKFLIADNTKQKEFAKKVEQINQNLEVQQKDLDRLQELFDQLLQKAFTGELTRGEAYGK